MLPLLLVIASLALSESHKFTRSDPPQLSNKKIHLGIRNADISADDPADKEENRKKNEERIDREKARKDEDFSEDERLHGKVKKHVKKALLSPIDAMRGELCLGRVHMIGHDKCMEWLVDECTSKSSGTGLCDRTRAKVKEGCLDGEEKACEYAKRLGIDVSPRTTEPPTTTQTILPTFTTSHLFVTTTQPPAAEIKGTTIPVAAAPAPAAAAAPETEAATEAATEAPAAPAPATEAPTEKPKEKAKEEKPKEEVKEEPKEEPKKDAKPSAPTPYEDPDAKAGLASQGFRGKPVIHKDGETMTGDWGKEYGGPEGHHSNAKSWNVHPLMYLAAAVLACVSA